MNTMYVIPPLKKPTLSCGDLSSYRPISNLPFLSKLLYRQDLSLHCLLRTIPPLISLNSRVSFLSTPYDSIAVHVTFCSMLSKALVHKAIETLNMFLVAFSPISLNSSTMLHHAHVSVV